MVYMNTKLIAYLMLNLVDAATNSSFAGRAMALKMTNGSPLHYYKTVRSSMFGMTLVVMGQAMHSTFHLGFKTFPGGLMVAPHTPFFVVDVTLIPGLLFL